MIYLVFGRREQGKTTLAYWMARRAGPRLIFDPRGLIRLRSTVTHRIDLREAADELRAGERAEVVYTPYEDDLATAFTRFCGLARRWVFDDPRRPLAVLVDEVAFVSTDDLAFQWLLRCSSRSIVHVFVTGHRPVDVRPNVRAIADHWLLFAMRQEHDLQVLDERCSVEAVREVRTLQPRQFVQWDDTQARHKVFKNPQEWYIDLDPHNERSRGADPLAAIAENSLT
jgi:hypothetical protein